MTYFSQLDCCSVLGIDPKTLRQWMRQAHVQFAPHPTDARLKCLTTQHVQQLAAQHARPLPWPITSPPRPPDAESPPEPSPTLTEGAATPQQLAHLQRSLITAQEKVTAGGAGSGARSATAGGAGSAGAALAGIASTSCGRGTDQRGERG